MIDGRHVAQAHDNDGLEDGEVGVSSAASLPAAPTRKGPWMQDGDVGRDHFVLEDVGAASARVLGRDQADGGGLRDAVDMKARGAIPTARRRTDPRPRLLVLATDRTALSEPRRDHRVSRHSPML